MSRLPDVAERSPATSLRNVDFPQPDGPTIETNSPALIVVLMPLIASESAPKLIASSRAAINGCSSGGGIAIGFRGGEVSEVLAIED